MKCAKCKKRNAISNNSYCLLCNREYKRAYFHRHPEKKVAFNAKVTVRRAALRQYVLDAKNKPCSDCGLAYPFYVMDFDHLGDKKFKLSAVKARGYALEKVQAEIAKCEVVCANCHRARTHFRMVKSAGPAAVLKTA